MFFITVSISAILPELGRSYERYLAKPVPKLILYRMNWCAHCDSAMKALESLVDEYSVKTVLIGQANCLYIDDHCIALEIEAFPTIFFHYGGKSFKYEGDVAHIQKWLADQLK